MSDHIAQHVNPKSDIEIAREASPSPIVEVARAKLGLDSDCLIPYGDDKAKVSSEAIDSLGNHSNGKLILVTAITPTPAGEGKTTTTIGLADGLQRIGKQSAICLREPSLGPCFGMKGGAAGGGYAQVVPMEDINLHFTGDFHAVGASNNLLAAMIDNHIYWGNQLGIDTRRVTWRRVVDMNDRGLRGITTGIGGVANGFPREDSFDITVASEVMAVLCLANDLTDLERRLGRIIVGETTSRTSVSATDLKAYGAMTALLKDAFLPNLVQSLEGTPALVHGGPFANIAHGCNSVVATRAALKLSDYVVTEAGFGADLGAEKFFNIKCRQTNLTPDCAVLVATVRALKMHGGVERDTLEPENISALEKGCANLARHVENLRKFGVPTIVAINRFSADTRAEVESLHQFCAEIDVDVIDCDHWAVGSAGAVDLAEAVVALTNSKLSKFEFLYPDNMALWDKARTIAQQIYGARGIIADQRIRERFSELQESGHGNLPVCIAKTQYSFSTDPNLKGAPSNHVVPIREVRLAAGAGFVIVVCGDIMTMPGLPRHPAAEQIFLDEHGKIAGLF